MAGRGRRGVRGRGRGGIGKVAREAGWIGLLRRGKGKERKSGGEEERCTMTSSSFLFDILVLSPFTLHY